ncbi:G-protein-signaling modulator 2 [Echinococcus granulosus]|uniref:G-protein-signaling modulator 2 n=1 Tax=Echinococcus granulosus TaxID=6210 RepID=W6U6W4_ECHGR|nr:G-protein-signaling modulator 2 [Echinococcus granulosus]EUB56111.1 G-protein-signaling modulator 2 [Echinococcus granulosus]
MRQSIMFGASPTNQLTSCTQRDDVAVASQALTFVECRDTTQYPSTSLLSGPCICAFVCDKCPQPWALRKFAALWYQPEEDDIILIFKASHSPTSLIGRTECPHYAVPDKRMSRQQLLTSMPARDPTSAVGRARVACSSATEAAAAAAVARQFIMNVLILILSRLHMRKQLFTATCRHGGFQSRTPSLGDSSLDSSWLGHLLRLAVVASSTEILTDFVPLMRMSLQARQTGDLHGEAKACANLSTCFKMIEKYPEAVLCAKRQLEICRRFNDKAAIARALHNLGNAYHAKGRQFLQFSGTDQLGEFTSEAKQDQEKALACFQQTGDLHGEAKACANLSTCFKMIEKYPEAVLCAKRQLEICRRFNDKAAIARALHNLGNAYHAKGRQFLQFSGTDQLGEFTSEAKQDQEKALACFQ